MAGVIEHVAHPIFIKDRAFRFVLVNRAFCEMFGYARTVVTARAQAAVWKKFGPKGSILTEAECKQAGGRFVPQLFGWMVHVHPFAETPEKIWTH